MNANDYLKLYQNLTANGYTGTMEELMQQILADQDTHTVDQQIGMVTAYAYAVSKGYTGTEDEFAELMANLGTTAQEIKAAVEYFVNITVPAAVQQVTTTGETQVQTVNAAGAEQRQSVTEAGTQQLQAINTAGEAVMTEAERSASAAAESATEAGSAKTDAEAAKTEAQRAASAAADSSTAAATSAALATSVVNMTDKDDENKLYAMAWSVENGFPVLTLTERT